MASSVFRRRRLLLGLLLVALAQGGLGFVLACPAVADDASAATPAVAAPAAATMVEAVHDPPSTASAAHQVEPCPGCRPGQVAISREMAAVGDGVAGVGPSDQDAVAVVAVGGHVDCREDRPCQRESPPRPAVAEAVTRALDGSRDGGPSTRLSCLDAPLTPASRVGSEPVTAAPPLRPAVLAPVAVLCVDRN